jgi:hypothetical protein
LPENPEPGAQLVPKKASLLQVVRIVISMLFMIGRKQDYEPDAPTIGLARLISVACIAAALLIASLVLLATFVTR